MEYKTIEEATRAWVNEFNAIPTDMINQLMTDHPGDWREVTTPSVGDQVYAISYDKNGVTTWNRYGEIIDIKEDNEDESILYGIKFDDCQTDEIFWRKLEDVEVFYDDYLPMWGTMWSFGDSCDDYWLEEMDGIRKMSECGFRIYHHEEWGYFFGIDGAGYDFYEHWISLYKARGLKWHKEGESEPLH